MNRFKWLVVAAVAAPLVVAGASPGIAQTTGETMRDYPVTVGKRTIMASQLEAMRAVEQRRAPRQQVEARPSDGAFTRQGKAIVYVKGDQVAPGTGRAVSAELPEERREVSSTGRFVHRGKAIIWVPDGAAEPR